MKKNEEEMYNINGKYKLYYDSFKSHDGGNAYINFNIKIKWENGIPTAESITATFS